MTDPIAPPKPLEASGALIVGGSAGIGFAAAEKLVLAGVPRIVIVARNAERGEQARARLEGHGAEAHLVAGDATRADEAARITAEALLGGSTSWWSPRSPTTGPSCSATFPPGRSRASSSRCCCRPCSW